MLDPSRRVEVPGFPQASVYRDHQQERTYYVVPWSAAIATDAGGRSECRLLLFVKREQGGASIATGGQLTLTTTLSVSESDLAAIERSIAASLTPSAIPNQPPPPPVVVQVVNPDWASGRVTVTAVPGLVLTGQPSLGGRNRCVLMASLSADGARALKDRWARGLPDARIVYEMTMRVAASQSASGSARRETVAVGEREVIGATAAIDVDVRSTAAQTQPITVDSPFRAGDLDRLVTEITI
jgi:hypothetical protein